LEEAAQATAPTCDWRAAEAACAWADSRIREAARAGGAELAHRGVRVLSDFCLLVVFHWIHIPFLFIIYEVGERLVWTVA
jgi:hypothetical protein